MSHIHYDEYDRGVSGEDGPVTKGQLIDAICPDCERAECVCVTFQDGSTAPMDRGIVSGSFEAPCGRACGYQEPYGFVPEADCPVHDAPILKDIPKKVAAFGGSDVPTWFPYRWSCYSPLRQTNSGFVFGK